MKKDDIPKDELRSEYKFSEMKNGVRGKYAHHYRSGTNLVKIDPDVAAVFCDDDAVNEALRELIKIARQQVVLAH